MTKKEKMNVFTGIAISLLLFGKVLSSLFLGILNIPFTENISRIEEIAYFIYAGFLMIYMIFFLSMEEKENRLYYSKKRMTDNLVAIIAMEMLLFMIAFVNYAISHPESGAPFPTNVVYPSYLAIMIFFAAIALLLRNRRTNQGKTIQAARNSFSSKKSMTKKEKVNVFTGIAIFLLLFARILGSILISFLNIPISESFGKIEEIAYVIFAALLMIYIIFFLSMEEKENRLYCSKKRMTDNLFAIFAMEMLFFMIVYIYYCIYHMEYVASFSTQEAYWGYIIILFLLLFFDNFWQKERNNPKQSQSK